MGRAAISSSQTFGAAALGRFVPGRGARGHETPHHRPRDPAGRHEPALPLVARLHRLVQGEDQAAPGRGLRLRPAGRAERVGRASEGAQEHRAIPSQGGQMRTGQEPLPRRGVDVVQPTLGRASETLHRAVGRLEQKAIRPRHVARFHTIGHGRVGLVELQGGDGSDARLERQEFERAEHRTVLRGIFKLLRGREWRVIIVIANLIPFPFSLCNKRTFGSGIEVTVEQNNNDKFNPLRLERLSLGSIRRYLFTFDFFLNIFASRIDS